AVLEGVGSLLLVPIVRPDYPDNELVPDDVAFVEVDEGDPLDVLQDLAGDHQTGTLVLLQGALTDAAVHNSLRAIPETREEHLHLCRRGVLRLIEDDERFVQCSTPHESQGRGLDLAALHRACEALRWHELIQRVVEGTQIWIDLLREITGKESK